MIKVINIKEVNKDYIICSLSNKQLKKIYLKPLIDKHRHLKGIEKMNDENYIKLAEIGIFGEIFWPETIINEEGDTWNYDISPEYIQVNGESLVVENEKIIE